MSTTASPRKSKNPKSRTPTRTRGLIQARGTNRWLVRVFIGTTPDGKRNYSAETIRGTRKDAERALTRKLAELDAGTFVEPAKQTLRQHLASWLETAAKPKVSARTLMDYTSSLQRYVFPSLGNRRLDRVTPQDIQALYASLQERGLEANTIRLVHAPLKQALKRAVAWGLLARNPAEYVSPPRLTRKERVTLTPEQTNRFLVVARADEWYALWCVLLLGGLRPSEAFALKWEDLEGSKLRVQRALKKVGRSQYEPGEPKSASGRQTVDLPPTAVAALAEHRHRQAEAILAAGPTYARRGFIFANAAGQPLDITKVRKRWKALLSAAGLPDLRLYDSRHTHATVLFREGTAAKLVQERLGHASITLTLDTYTHVIPGMGEAVADTLHRMLERERLAS